jgi:uncharacterized protein YggU (UPF0235/DUF167 family)
MTTPSLRLTVHVRPNSRVNLVTQTSEDTYSVLTTATPERGKANDQVIRLLAKHLNLPPRRLRLVLGKTAREKLIEVMPE